MSMNLLSLLAIDKRSSVQIEEQIIQSVRELIYQQIIPIHTEFPNAYDLIQHFKISSNSAHYIIDVLVKKGFLKLTADGKLIISDYFSLSYVFPRPFGRRIFKQQETNGLVEKTVHQKQITTPTFLKNIFPTSTVYVIEKDYFLDDALRVNAIYYKPCDSSHSNDPFAPNIINENDLYIRNISLSSNKDSNTTFNTSNEIYLKGEFIIVRDHKIIEYGEVISSTDYSFKINVDLDALHDF